MQKILALVLLACAVLVLVRRFRRAFGKRISNDGRGGNCGGGCGCR